jgi:hypothetical protein
VLVHHCASSDARVFDRNQRAGSRDQRLCEWPDVPFTMPRFTKDTFDSFLAASVRAMARRPEN